MSAEFSASFAFVFGMIALGAYFEERLIPIQRKGIKMSDQSVSLQEKQSPIIIATDVKPIVYNKSAEVSVAAPSNASVSLDKTTFMSPALFSL
jgi:hypothetical protein